MTTLGIYLGNLLDYAKNSSEGASGILRVQGFGALEMFTTCHPLEVYEAHKEWEQFNKDLTKLILEGE